MLGKNLECELKTLVASILVLTACYLAFSAVYHLWFHPLAEFPGPKLAATTKCYEFYYDVIRGGQFFKEIQRMHAIYGPIVRINPNELHINDATYYKTLYAGGSHKRDKYVWFTNAAGSPTSTFATESHNLHRLRRGALNPFFSKQSVVKLEPLIHEKTELLCKGIESQYREHIPFDFAAAYMSFALDTVSHYAFGESECWNCLHEPGFSKDWKEAVVTSFENATLMRYLPWVVVPLLHIPYQWIMRVHKPMGTFFKTFSLIKGHVLRFLASEAEATCKSARRATIFSELRDGNLPAPEKKPRRLIDEGAILIIAGGEAITQLLTVISFHLLDNHDILQKLRTELDTVMPASDTPISWAELAKLPYLSAVIQEGLRISAIVTTRLPRIAPDEIREYENYKIPMGTPVSMTSHFIHLDPNIWPEPLKFIPERWMECDSEVAKANPEFLVPFSKGSRGCIGIKYGTSFSSAGAFLYDGSADQLSCVTNLDGTTTNLIFDVHIYLDSDGTGTHSECTTGNVQVFTRLATWLRKEGRQAFLSETGGGNTSSCVKYMRQQLQTLMKNSDVYLGWTGWAAGKFKTTYVLSETPFGEKGKYTDQLLVTKAIAGVFNSA